MKNTLVDTDVLIDFSKRKDKILKKYFGKKDQWQLWVNPVIVAEWFNNRELCNTEKLEKAKVFIDLFNCAEIGKEEGERAGALIRNNEINYLGDALIAATCLVKNASLITRNIKHYKNVKGLKLLD